MRVFIISPANCSGKRARKLLERDNSTEWRRRLDRGVPLGELFTYLSGLYFRGKLTYARAFARPPRGVRGAYVITGEGLLPPEKILRTADLRRLADKHIGPREIPYLMAFESSLVRLRRRAPGARFVHLGSVASEKYVKPLTKILKERVEFPVAFAGRGDLSRGGLLLRCVESATELETKPILTANRHGDRPPALADDPFVQKMGAQDSN